MHFLLEDSTCSTCDAIPDPQSTDPARQLFSNWLVCFVFFFFIFLSDTRGYCSERRRRDWCETRVWPFTEARWSSSRASDNSSFPPCKRIVGLLSGIRLASIHTPEVISSPGGRGRASLCVPSPALRCRLQEKKTTNRPNHFLCVCMFCVLFDLWGPHFERVPCWRPHTGLSRELTAKLRPPSSKDDWLEEHLRC